MPLTPSARRGAPRRRARAAGFTLAELLVAVTLGLVVVSAAGALLVGQLRAFARTHGGVAVQRDLRLGLALLPMDLRGASRSDGDLLVLGASELELRATVASSVVCEAPGASKTELVLPPPDIPQVALTSIYSTPQPGDTVKVLIRNEQGGVGDAWLTAAVGPDSLWTSPTGAGGLCAGAPAPPLRLRLVWQGAPPASQLALVVPGMPVRVLRRVRYALDKAPSGRWYLAFSERRSDGTWSAREPVAGPFAAGGSAGPGVRFAYFDTAGAALPAPVADPTRVGRVDITLRARTAVRAGSGAAADSVVARDSAVVRVALRNRR
jgi:hypothetical protein